MKRKVLVWMTVALFVFLVMRFVTHTRFQLTDEDRAFLKARGPLVYASDNNSPPLRYYDALAGQYKGVVVDYINALALELETEIVLVPMVWNEALDALEKGETDLCDMYPSEERSKIFLFSEPVYYQRGVILVPGANTEIKSKLDLSKRRVAVQKGDYVEGFLRETVEGIEYVHTPDYEAGLKLLISGEVDALVGDEPVISYFLSKYDLIDQFIIADEPLYQLPSVLSMPLHEKKLQHIINKGIYALNQKTVLDKIQQKWFGISTPISLNSDTNRLMLLLLFTGIIAFSGAAVILVWNFELKKAVDRQTQALKVNMENLHTIIDELDQLIFVVDQKDKVLIANRKFYEICDECTSAPLKMVSDEEYILKGRTYMVHSQNIHHLQSLDDATLYVLEDITERKINTHRMLQDNKMSAVGQLATGVAHEIRNPLGLIRNYAFLMKRQSDDANLLKQSISIIEESVDKASHIIDNLLNFSRLSDEIVKDVNLKVFIENLVKLNDKLMNQSRLKCRLILEDVTIAIYEESLKHVVMNLMNNAIDAMPSGGQLTLWLYENEIGPVLHIIDSGIGMTAATKEKLFDPFFTTKRVGEGTGLGLYIAYNEVVKMGGAMHFISKVGRGTIVKLQLVQKEDAAHAKYRV